MFSGFGFRRSTSPKPENITRGLCALADGALLVALALGVRVAFVLAMPRVIDSADAIHYIDTVKHFASGDFWGFNAKIPVLYPTLAALIHLFVRDVEWACYGVSIAASALLVIPVYALSRDLHGQRTARVAGVVVAIWPWLVDWGYRIGPDALGCTLWFLSIWLFARGIRRGGVWLAAAPLAFFGLHLTRPEGTVLIAAAFVASLALCLGGEQRTLRRLIPFAAECAVLLLAYSLYMRMVTGGATVNYRAHFIFQEFEFTRFAATALKTIADVLPIMLGPALMIFLGVGLFHRDNDEASPPRDPRLECYVFLFVAAQWAASLSVLSAEPRYLMSVIVALSLWSARGMAILSRAATALPFGRWLRLLPLSVVVCLMALGFAMTLGAEHLDKRPGQPREYKIAGLWMKDNLPPGLIFTRKPQVGYYADMPSTGPDQKDSLQEALARARTAGARYVVVDERYTAQMAPGLAPLLNPALAPPDVRLLKEFTLFPESKVVVYELAAAGL